MNDFSKLAGVINLIGQSSGTKKIQTIMDFFELIGILEDVKNFIYRNGQDTILRTFKDAYVWNKVPSMQIDIANSINANIDKIKEITVDNFINFIDKECNYEELKKNLLLPNYNDKEFLIFVISHYLFDSIRGDNYVEFAALNKYIENEKINLNNLTPQDKSRSEKNKNNIVYLGIKYYVFKKYNYIIYFKRLEELYINSLPNFLYNSDKNLNEVYIKPNLILSKKNNLNKDIKDFSLDIFSQNVHLVKIIAEAGSGKTYYMTSILQEAINNFKNKKSDIMPVFFKFNMLKKIPEDHVDLLHIIYNSEKNKENENLGYVFLSKEEFVNAYNNGKILLLLDGFDEIKRSFFNKVTSALRLAYHRNAKIIISHRPLQNNQIHYDLEFKIQPFNESQKIDFINLYKKNLDKDEEFDEKGLINFISNKELLSLSSNPLILSVLIKLFKNSINSTNQLNFESRASIYGNAIETLFRIHDKKKPFDRNTMRYKNKYDDISENQIEAKIEEIKKTATILSAIAYLNDCDSFYQFDKTYDYLFESHKDYEDLLQDCFDNFNILNCINDRYTYLHKSFQEYFTACYCIDYFPYLNEKQLDLLIEKRDYDLVIPFIYDLCKNNIYEILIYKYLSINYKMLNSKKQIMDIYIELANKFLATAILTEDFIAVIVPNNESNIMNLLYKILNWENIFKYKIDLNDLNAIKNSYPLIENKEIMFSSAVNIKDINWKINNINPHVFIQGIIEKNKNKDFLYNLILYYKYLDEKYKELNNERILMK